MVALVLGRVTTPSPARSVLTLPTPSAECTTALAQILADSGVSGAVTFAPDGTLQIQVWVQPFAGDDPADGAQTIWTVFDGAASLPATCSFQRLDVTVQAAPLQMQAQVLRRDLDAWAEGALSDDELIERVAYTQTPLPTDQSPR